MAIILDKDGETTRRAAAAATPVRTANYPIYPSENPGDPYIPVTDTDSWWDGIPSSPTNWDPKSATSEHYEAFLAYEEMARRNGTLVFERDETFKRHQYANKTYSGVDMVASISLPGQASFEFADLSTLSVSTHRESFPVRTLGMTNPMGFTSGPRTIAGSMIFTVIDAYSFYKVAQDLYGRSAKSLWDDTGNPDYPLADSLPPFDITITFNNEYEPQGAVLRIFGVKIIDDGMTLSIDDLVSENTYSFMAAGIAPIHRAKNWVVKK